MNFEKMRKEFERLEMKRIEELEKGGKELERLRREFDELARRVDEIIRKQYLYICGKEDK